MNQQDKHHSFALMDEAAQIFIPNIADIPATARSNKVSFNIVAQDILQFESLYSRPVSDSLIGNLNYQIYLKNCQYRNCQACFGYNWQRKSS